MLTVDTVVYLLIAFYVEAVMPGRYGIARNPFFPLQPLWTLAKAVIGVCMGVSESTDGSSNDNSVDANTGNNFEPEPKGVAGVVVNKLSKHFGDKVAVDDLCLNMYRGQVRIVNHTSVGLLVGAVVSLVCYSFVQP